MAKLLVEKGADLTHKDRHNKTVVEIARRFKCTAVAEFLAM